MQNFKHQLLTHLGKPTFEQAIIFAAAVFLAVINLSVLSIKTPAYRASLHESPILSASTSLQTQTTNSDHPSFALANYNLLTSTAVNAKLPLIDIAQTNAFGSGIDSCL